VRAPPARSVGGVQEPNHGTDCRAFKEKLNKQADRFTLMPQKANAV
jgi:hypothetical protein